MRSIKAVGIGLLVVVVGVSAGGCSNTMRGVRQDTERAAEKTAAGLETVDVKSALVADGRVNATNINVDTIASSKTVVLKGSVTTTEQKTLAESIAREHAKGYKIDNQLTIVPQ